MTPPSWLISLYGALCIIEILAVRLKIVLIDPFDADGMVRPHCTITGIQRSIVCPLFNNLEMMLWFACLMTFLMGGWARARRSRTRSSSRRTCSGASPSTPTA